MGRTSRKRRLKNQIFNNFLSNDEEIFEKLKSWMLCNNWKPTCNLVPYNFKNTGRGLMAIDKIEINNIILQIPKNLLITTYTVSQSSIGKLFSIDQTYSAQSIISIFLIYEKHLANQSFWKPYLDTLPQSYTNPEFCTKLEKKFFPNFLKDDLYLANKKLKSNYLNIIKTIKLLNNKNCNHCQQSFFQIFSYKNFVWAYFTVNTRSIYMNNKNQHQIKVEGDDNLAMAPLLDMFNHDCETAAEAQLVYFYNDEQYQIKALRSYEPKMQIFINYGSHNNLKLYFEYGFFVPNNYLDQICFNLSDIEKCHQISKSAYSLIKSNNFEKSMAFTIEGLNYNAKYALLIITSNTNIKHMKNKIYQNNLNSEDLKLLYEVAKILWKQKKNEYEQLLKCMKKIICPSKSFSTFINFIHESLLVLEKSLSNISSNY